MKVINVDDCTVDGGKRRDWPALGKGMGFCFDFVVLLGWLCAQQTRREDAPHQLGERGGGGVSRGRVVFIDE